MALKEQVSNVYGVGLRNVGSYQVSGVPHITTATIADRAETSISFPQVTKNITFNKTTTGGEVRIHFLSKGTQKQALKFKDITPNDNVLDNYFSSGITRPVNTATTISFWFKQETAYAYTNTQLPLWYAGGGVGIFSQTAKIMYLPPNAGLGYPVGYLRYRLNVRDQGPGGVGQTDFHIPADEYTQTDYNNLIISIGTTSWIAYINGSSWNVTTPTSLPNGPELFQGLHFPRSNSGQMTLAQATVWDKALTEAEAVELYNSGKYSDPRTHSAATNLINWLAFDPTLTPADTTSAVYDRVGSITGSVLLGSGQTATAEYVDGPGDFLTGSNVIGENHFITLSDARPSITLNCKCNKVYLSASGSSQTVSVTANMTHIPSGSMFALTGSGIDE